MGIETIAIVGLSALSAANQMQQGANAAKATIATATNQGNNLAKQSVVNGAKLQSSFLQSGLTLEGTPQAAIQQTYTTGLQDINTLADSANSKAKSKISQARTAALTGLAKSAAFAGAGGFGSFEDDINSAGQTVGGAFDPSPMGPYQSPFSQSSGFWRT